MSPQVILRPGQASLADWRAIYRGADVAVDPVSRADVEAGAAALEAILARAVQPAANGGGDVGPAVVDLLHKGASYAPPALARLFVALKLAALAQGVAGVKWRVIERLTECLSHDLLPAIPDGNASDRLASAHLFGVLTGAGDVLSDRRPAAGRALKAAGLAPLKLSAQERSALLSGAEMSTAFALAGLFEAERVFQSALVACAFSAAARDARRSILHSRVHRLHRQPGELDVAQTLRRLLDATDADAARADGPASASVESRGGSAQMGACLDLLREAGRTLERAANAVTADRLVLWQSQEIVAGVEDCSAVSLAADLVSLALREIGNLAERRIATLRDPAALDEAEQEARQELRSGRAASFAAENRARGEPVGFDPAGVRRLLPMAGSAALILAVEVLATARLKRSADAGAAVDGPQLDWVARLLRDSVPLADDGHDLAAAELASAADLVRTGALAELPGVALPDVGTQSAQVAPLH